MFSERGRDKQTETDRDRETETERQIQRGKKRIDQEKLTKRLRNRSAHTSLAEDFVSKIRTGSSSIKHVNHGIIT